MSKSLKQRLIESAETLLKRDQVEEDFSRENFVKQNDLIKTITDALTRLGITELEQVKEFINTEIAKVA